MITFSCMSTPTKFCAAVCVIPSLLFPRRPILCSPLHPWPRYNPSIGSSLLLGSHLITFMCLTVSLARSHMAYFLGFLPLFLPDLILSLFLLQRLLQHFLPPDPAYVRPLCSSPSLAGTGRNPTTGATTCTNQKHKSSKVRQPPSCCIVGKDIATDRVSNHSKRALVGKLYYVKMPKACSMI